MYSTPRTFILGLPDESLQKHLASFGYFEEVRVLGSLVN